MSIPITREYLLQLFDYDRERGILIWKNHWCRARSRFIGKIAGCRKQDGHWHLRINNKLYLRHRVIWFIEKGTWPEVIDHIQGSEKGDQISNLRVSTHRLNANNSYRHREGKLTGASFHKNSGRWTSQYHVNNKKIHLGYFNSEIEAHQRWVREVKTRGLI